MKIANVLPKRLGPVTRRALIFMRETDVLTYMYSFIL